MRSEQPRTAATTEQVGFFRQNIQPVGIQHHRLFDPGNQVADSGPVRRAQARPDGPDIDLLVRQILIASRWFHHHFGPSGRGGDFINLFGNEKFHQSRTGPQRTAGGQERGADESFRAGYDRDSPHLILVGAEFSAGHEPRQRRGRGDDFVAGAAGLEIGQWPDDQATDKIDNVVGNQSMLGKTNGDGEIGLDRIGIHLAGVAVQSAGNIDREDDRIFFHTEGVKLAGGSPNRLAQEPFGADAEESIENDGAASQCGSPESFRGDSARRPLPLSGSRRAARFLRVNSLQSASGKGSRVSTFQPSRCKQAAATRASPPL